MTIEVKKAEYRFNEIDETLNGLDGGWSYDENGVPLLYLDEMITTDDMKVMIRLEASFPYIEPNIRFIVDDEGIDLVLYLYRDTPNFDILVADSDLLPEKSYRKHRYTMMSEKRALLKKGATKPE